MSTIQDSVRDSIQKTLRSLGVTPNYQGYYQVTDAIELAVEDENRLLEATKKIYQRIADRDGYKWSAVKKLNAQLMSEQKNARTSSKTMSEASDEESTQSGVSPISNPQDPHIITCPNCHLRQSADRQTCSLCGAKFKK